MTKRTYFETVNLDVFKAMLLRADNANKTSNYMEAALIVFSAVEGMLRDAISLLADKDLEKYWTDPRTSFSRLISTYELLGSDRDIILKLRSYNSTRNKIVHAMSDHRNIQELDAAAAKSYSTGREIIQLFGEKHPHASSQLPDHPQYKPKSRKGNTQLGK